MKESELIEALENMVSMVELGYLKGAIRQTKLIIARAKGGMMEESELIDKTYYEWPEQGYIPENAYPLEVIHQDDTGYVLLQVDPMDDDSLIVVASIDFDYEREGAVARKDIAGKELAPYRKLNLGNFFEDEDAMEKLNKERKEITNAKR